MYYVAVSYSELKINLLKKYSEQWKLKQNKTKQFY